jgi:protein-S-isoprenylcysteine O-methyltransferase Ste14
LPVALVLLVTVTDAAGAPSLSFYLLLAAVPAIVVAGLAAVEERLQGALAHRKAIGMLHVLTLLLVLVAAALRSPARAEGTIPRAGISAVVACLVVFAIQGLLAALPALRRSVPAQPEPREISLP